MAKSEKVSAVAEIAEQFKGSTATVVTEYRGLSVKQITELRRSLGEGATYSVAKNTLVKRAAVEAGVEGLDELFTGPTPDPRRMRDSEYARSVLAELRPVYPPGTLHMYHGLTWGPIVRELVELAERHAIGAIEYVISEHCGNRDAQAYRGHDKGFADRTGNSVHRSIAACADLEQCVVNAPYRTQ